jgi:hypothetical protein
MCTTGNSKFVVPLDVCCALYLKRMANSPFCCAFSVVHDKQSLSCVIFLMHGKQPLSRVSFFWHTVN